VKVLLVGDTHGDAQFISSINKCAKINGAQYVIQLGDFGFDFNPNVLTSIRAWLDADERRRWLWLDGNHDQHDYIRTEICKGKHPKKPVAHFHDRMFYCPRGSTLKVGKKKVLFLGGAVSIDKDRRTQGVNWWPQEHISTADAHRAIDNGHNADVLLSHDAPRTGVLKAWLKRQGYKLDRASEGNRKAVEAVIQNTTVCEVYHGHYHHPYTDEFGTATVTGLGANYARGVHNPRAVLGENCLLLDW
jgi:predicted phosphodiesterase